MGNITPIHKSGPADAVINYRPFSVTCILCKISEHDKWAKWTDFFTVDKLNSGEGFSVKHVCMLHSIVSTVLRHKSFHASVLYFSKAFDRELHALLMEKLSMIEEMEKYLLEWVHCFLHCSSQLVILNGCKLSLLPILML